MMMKRIFAIVIAVLSVTSLLTFSEISEGTDNLDGRTKETAIYKNILLDVNETKLLYFNSNMNTYEFMNEGDGYSYTIEQLNEVGKIERTLTDPINRVFNDTLPSQGGKVIHAEYADVTFYKNGNYGSMTVAVSLTEQHSADFYLKFSVTSYGLSQIFYYRIHLTYDPPEVYTFDFVKVNMDYEGNFFTQGSIFCNDIPVDKTQFRYFATGLYSGISLHNDLTVTGVVDETDRRWLTTTTIQFTIVATNVDSHEVFVSPASIKFTYDRTFETPIEFTLKEGGKELITENSANKSVTVLENADLTLTIDNGTSAEVVYTDNSGTVKKYLWTLSNGSVNSPIATNGAGKYDVTLRQLDGSTDMFSINVIATLVPVNKIYVTCSSV